MEKQSKLSPEFKGVVLFQNGIWTIEKCTIPATGKPSLVAIKLAFYTHFVTIYEDKSIGLDFPERIPKTIKEKLSRLAKAF